MESLVQKLEHQFARLPVSLSVALPGGRRVGPSDAAVQLAFQDWGTVATLAAGQVGKVGEDYVEQRVRIEGANARSNCFFEEARFAALPEQVVQVTLPRERRSRRSR